MQINPFFQLKGNNLVDAPSYKTITSLRGLDLFKLEHRNGLWGLPFDVIVDVRSLPASKQNFEDFEFELREIEKVISNEISKPCGGARLAFPAQGTSHSSTNSDFLLWK